MKKPIFDKRAQAALEFLTTYGWAFLVILIMISALAYFGILNPSRLLPDRCTFGTEFDCQDYLISKTNNELLLRLRNNVGQTISVTELNATSETATSVRCEGSDIDILQSWGASQVKDINITCINYDESGFIQGDKGKINIKLTYYTVKSGPAYLHDVHGDVYATIK